MTAWNKKRRMMRQYDQSARVYDGLYGEEQEAKIKTAVSNLALKQDELVLDAGCGTGLLFKHVAGKTGSIVGADASFGLLREAEKKAKTYKNVALVQADSDHLPFRDEIFHFVFAVTVLQNMPSPQATLDEIKRVSKPSVRIIVTGLRKTFTQETFEKTLSQARLRAEFLGPDEKKRDYVAVCTKNAPLSLNSPPSQL